MIRRIREWMLFSYFPHYHRYNGNSNRLIGDIFLINCYILRLKPVLLRVEIILRIAEPQKVNSIYQFITEGIRGGTIDFSQMKGKKIMIVNVASECGYTPQYEQLQELYDTFQDTLVIVGFPCNDFGGQEPEDNEAIYTFCQSLYGVSFPMAAKISIKQNTHPIYEWLCKASLNGQLDTEVKWNFHKFLIDENGQLQHSFPSAVSPLDENIINWLTA